MSEISHELDLSIDLSLEYAMSLLAGGERLQPFASYESDGEVTRAFFLGVGDPDPVREAHQWVAGLPTVTRAVIVAPGQLTFDGGRTIDALIAKAWERGMERTLVVAQEYEEIPGGDPEQGTPAARAIGGQLEIGEEDPLWHAPPEP